MKKSFIILMITLLGNQLLYAQNFDSLKVFVFKVNVHQTDFDQFNQQAASLGYPALFNEIAEFSFGCAVKKDKWLDTYAISFGVSTDSNETETNVPGARFEYAGLNFSTSYNLLKGNSPWFVGPKLGLQFRAEQIVLTDNKKPQGLQAASQTDFLKLNRLHLPIEGGLTVMKLFKTGKDKNNSILIAFSGGYSIDTNADAWRIDQAVPIGENGINMAGIQAGFSIGFNFS